MNKLVKTLGVVTLISMFALPAIAERPHGRHGKHRGDVFMNVKMLERVADKINLNEATVEAIKEKIYEGQKAAIELQAKLKSQKLDLRRELDSTSPNRSRVMNLIDETGALHTKLKKHRIGLMLEVRSMLTPAQIKQVKKLRREFKSKRVRRRGDRKHKAGVRHFERNGEDH